MGTSEQSCQHCKKTFTSAQGVRQHERQCVKRLPTLYRLANLFARRKMGGYSFDRRTNEAKIFEYAILRFYVDRFEFWLAVLVLLSRCYFAFPWAEWLKQPLHYSGVVPPGWLDLAVLGYSVYTIVTRRQLINDYKLHVMRRIERIGQ